jgi:hypothetical protein
MQHDPPSGFTWSVKNLRNAQAHKLWKKDQLYSKRTHQILTLESTSDTQKQSHHIDFNPADGNLRVHSHSLTYDHPAYDELKLRLKFP